MYVEEVRKRFKEAHTEAHLQTNNEVDRQKWYYDRATSTMQLMLGDIVLMKLDTFQGKRKVKDRWSEVEYVVTCQVANDVPAYKVRDDGKNVKVAHHNRLFLVAPARDVAIPLGGSESISYVGATQSTLAELTPLEWKGEMSESDVEGALTWCLTSSAWVGRWCSMAATFSGPEINSMRVRFWWRNKQLLWWGHSLMPTGWTLQTGCHVPKPRVMGVGDACNREMGETFTGIRLSEATPHCLWSQVDIRKEDQISLCIPLNNSWTEPNLLYSYKSVALIFTWGRGTLTHSIIF